MPLHKRVSLAGEVFHGSNLGGFQAGVFQNYNTDYAEPVNGVLTARGVQGVRTTGGWTQLGFTPNWNKDKLTLYGSAGIDDPDNSDLRSARPRDFRSRNFSFAADAIYKVTPQFQFWIEVRRIITNYTLTGKKRDTHVNLGAAYSF